MNFEKEMDFENTAEEKTDSAQKKSAVKKLTDKFSKMPKKRLRIIAIILVVAIVAGCFFAYKTLFSDNTSSGKQLTAFASVGNVSSVIEGSGTIAALQQYEITSLKKGEVVADYFEEGDIVNEGDVLYLMDDTDGYDAIDNASSSLSRAQRSYSKAAEDLENLVVKSSSNGIITEMYITEGDNIGSNTKICDIIDNTQMLLEIQFLSEYATSMSAGASSAEVTLSKDGTTLRGTVTKVSTGSLINSVGASVTNVEITVPNPGAIKEGDYATAVVAGYACSSEGTFRYKGKSSVYSEVSGKVEALKVMKGDNISNGQTVAILSNEDISDLSESRDSLSEAQNQYADALEGLEDYVVKAPITGTIIQKNIKAGENLESSNTGTAMAIIADLSALVFEMSVDELDISKLEVGMDVEVTADAIENVTFGAKVTGISIVGSSNNGVTSYPVKITINSKEEQQGAALQNYDKLIPGLNVSASVVIERVENVIVVPVSAVRRGNIVIVSEDSSSEGIGIQSAPPMGDNMPMGTDRAMPSDGSAPQATPDGHMMPSGAPHGEMSESSGALQVEKTQSNDVKTTESPEKPNQDSGEAAKSGGNASKAEERMKNIIESMDIPAGYKAIVVETGLSDESFIEIKQGLAEGDKVLLPDTTASTQSNNQMGGMPGGMGGIPGGMGGMPGGMGGMPGGMRASGNRGGGGMR